MRKRGEEKGREGVRRERKQKKKKNRKLLKDLKLKLIGGFRWEYGT